MIAGGKQTQFAPPPERMSENISTLKGSRLNVARRDPFRVGGRED